MNRTAQSLILPAAILAATVLTPSPAGAGTPTCHGRAATIVGSTGADTLRGTRRADVIVARGGDDTVLAGGGADLVCGGDGADRLRGGTGDDALYGERDGRRTDRGGTLRTPDELRGGPGADLLDVGGDGRRVDQPAPHGIVTYADSRHPVQVDLEQGTASGAGADRIVVVRDLVVVGTPYADELRGSARADHLVGLGGDDHLSGGAGADELDPDVPDRDAPADDDTAEGGAGADDIVAWRGRDVLHGDDGDDVVATFSTTPTQVLGDAGDDDLQGQVTVVPGFVVDGGEGDDRATLASEGTGAAHLQDPGPPVVVRAAPGTVERDGAEIGVLRSVGVLALGSYLRWDYYGTEQADSVTGGAYWRLRAWTYGGDDHVSGSGKGDQIDAGDGNDRVQGWEGRDSCLNAEVVDSCEVVSP